jgi:acetyl/propionyl-CoA carboxylase alpha subunit
MQGVLLLGDDALTVRLGPTDAIGRTEAIVARDGDRIWVHLNGLIYALTWIDAVRYLAAADDNDADLTVRAPMPGTVIAIAVEPGRAVSAGDALLTIESMKLETVVRAAQAGVVANLFVTVGASFDRDDPLVQLANDPA